MAVNLQTLKVRPSPAALDEPPDHELIARVVKGEAAAFEKIMRRYNQRVFRAARSVLRNDAEAEDVVQETFVRAYKHLGEFEERSSLATWLTRIAVNEALSRVRRSRLFGALDSDKDQPEKESSVKSTQPGPEEQASSRELRSVLIAAIDSLPEEMRTVFVLREVEGLSTLDASEALQLSPEAVRVRLHRARLALRSHVEKQLGQEVQALFEFAGTRCDAMVTRVFRELGLPLQTL
ncbi:MAG: RNA polymerase sigma factor [Candidatus Binatia bacterium]